MSNSNDPPKLSSYDAIVPAMSEPMELPEFDPNAVFFDVEGDAVSFDSKGALRWVDGKPEPMSAASAARGVAISFARFKKLAKAAS